MQALLFFFRNKKILSAIRRRSSFRWGDFLPLSHPDVLFCHADGGVPQLIAGLSNVACRFFLICAAA
ncbi:hypothetical protein I4N56_002805 [Pseudomonas mohnii]|nr:hypothetical protein [Pseudomonas mohnii]